MNSPTCVHLSNRIASKAMVFCCFLTIGLPWTLPAYGEQKEPLPIEISSAKTVYIDNQTGDEHLLDAANGEFKSWGRFVITQSKADANLVIVFTHKLGLDRWGNASFIVMDVYIPGHAEQAFESKNAVKTVFAPEHRTRACIDDFRKRLEPKH